jgi:hypothetical protein
VQEVEEMETAEKVEEMEAAVEEDDQVHHLSLFYRCLSPALLDY